MPCLFLFLFQNIIRTSNIVLFLDLQYHDMSLTLVFKPFAEVGLGGVTLTGCFFVFC